MGGHQGAKRPRFGNLAIVLIVLSVLTVSGCGKRAVYAPTHQAGHAKQAVDPSAASAHGKPTKDPKIRPYTVMGKRYHPLSTSQGYSEVGVASWYGEDFHGKLTANGQVYDMYGVSAAHKTLPLGTKVEVTNLENGRRITLVINDRGPFVGDRLIDLSYGAAKALDMVNQGLAKVRIQAVGPAVGVHTAKAKTGRYYIQVGAFSERPNAKRLHQRLVRAGYAGSRITPVQSNGRTLHGVQAGAYSSLPTAKQALARLRQQFPSSYIASR